MGLIQSDFIKRLLLYCSCSQEVSPARVALASEPEVQNDAPVAPAANDVEVANYDDVSNDDNIYQDDDVYVDNAATDEHEVGQEYFYY